VFLQRSMFCCHINIHILKKGLVTCNVCFTEAQLVYKDDNSFFKGKFSIVPYKSCLCSDFRCGLGTEALNTELLSLV